MIFTFYSYKGGVGRSMAMAGIAHLFARRGLRVLAVDFDLEAPGLERYFFDGERARTVRAERGLLDLVRAYRQALSSESAFAQAEFKRWQSYVQNAIAVAGEAGGSVDLMTAGRREPEAAMRDYALTVRSFDWQDFFHNWKGDLFFDWLRRQVRDPSGGYDVVLVDSRTGVTEMGGVCAYQLADAAVLLCAPNYQNLEGTRDVARDFRSEGVRALRQGRPLEIVAVPARVEASHPKRAEFLARFREELGVEGLPAALAEAGLDYEKLALPYMPQFAVAERLVGDPQTDAIEQPPIEVFERLADALTLLADPDSALGRQRAPALARLTQGSAAASAGLMADVTRSTAGYDAFIDAARADEAIAVALEGAIESLGYRAFRDTASVAEGQDWQSGIARALAYSAVLFVCFGQPTDTEQRARLVAQARRLQTVQLVPVLLPGATPGVLASFDFGESQALDLRDWPAEAARERLLGTVRRLTQGKGPAESSNVQVNARDPYPGARPFDEDDAGYFFGRDAEIALLREAIGRHEIVLVSGPSQVGKTSLVRAGLVPALRKAGSSGPAFAGIDIVELADAANVRWPAWLDAPGDAANPPARLLVLDGFDTFHTIGVPAERASRIERLEHVIERTAGRATLVVVARDSLDPEERTRAWQALTRRSMTSIEIAPLAGDALRRAIEQPARVARHLVEPGLTERLIESAGAAKSAIAQIQRALAAIWPARVRGWITHKGLDAAGHLAGVVKQHHERALAELGDAGRAAARTLFGRLVTLSLGYELVPSPQPWSPIATVQALDAVDAVRLRDRLASAGIIDIYSSTPAVGASVAPAIAETHVALARADTVVRAADAGLELPFLIWREELAKRVLKRSHDDETPLLSGRELVEAQDWRSRLGESLTLEENAFVEASMRARFDRIAREEAREAAEREAEEAREREKREAAEALAAERGSRLSAEEQARKAAEVEAGLLRRSRRRLTIGLTLGAVLLGFAVFQTFNEREAREEAEDALARASDEAKRAKNERTLRDEEAQRAVVAATALEEALSAAQLAKRATESALAGGNANRREVEALLAQASQQASIAVSGVQQLQVDCPAGRLVYLHIGVETDRPAARRLIPQFEAADYKVPGIETIAKPPGVTDVRFFRDDDKAGAQAVMDVVRKAGVENVVVKDLSNVPTRKYVRPCQYEVWLAAGALPGPKKR